MTCKPRFGWQTFFWWPIVFTSHSRYCQGQISILPRSLVTLWCVAPKVNMTWIQCTTCAIFECTTMLLVHLNCLDETLLFLKSDIMYKRKGGIQLFSKWLYLVIRCKFMIGSKSMLNRIVLICKVMFHLLMLF